MKLNGIVYGIHCNITDENYVGSTGKTLDERSYSHKQKSNKCSSKIIIKRGDYEIVALEEVRGENLLKRERYWMDNTPHLINKIRSYVTNEERKKRRKDREDKIRPLLNGNTRRRRRYEKTWGDPISKLGRDTPHNLLLIKMDIFH